MKEKGLSMQQGRRILITGASGGLGRAIARVCAQKGFTCALHFHSNEKEAKVTQGLISQEGGVSSLLSFDCANRNQTREVLEADMRDNGAYYGVVLNAGIARDNAFPSLLDEEWDDVLKTNLDGFYNVLKPLIMPMIHLKQGGRIVTLSSVAGAMGNRGQVNYSAAKAGIIGATKALSLELAKRQITVNCVAPGIIKTAMTQELALSREDLEKLIPLRRLGSPQDVAGMVGFLLSDEASYITRQVIHVNGGLV